ncbi:MAG TPA: amidohydrolase family protein [Gaiellales bacterium]|nr:amidohydrolase family protein [Gaiellales bacterium]
MTELLVSGDVVLASADAPPLASGAVLIADGAIAEVGDRAALRRGHPDAQEVGGAGMLVLPGLINAHHHGMAISTVQLGFPDPGPPDPGMRDTPFESWMGTMLALDAIDPYLGTLCKDVLLIESGVTSHLHMHFPSGSGDGRAEDAYAGELRETLRAHRASGQRVALAPHWSDRSRLAYDGDDAFIASLPGQLQDRARRLSAARMPIGAYLDTMRELIGELGGDPLLSTQLAIMAPQWATDELVREVGRAADELGAGVHLHALESRLQRAWGDAFAGGRELERLADAGVLSDRSALAHGVWLRDSDVELLARTGATVVHNCSSNLRLATGIAPIRQLVGGGVSVALGLDDMGLADDDDMFAEVRVAHVMQRVHGAPEHPRLDPARLFGLVWEGGARVVGAAASIGRLEPGMRGDVVVLDLQALRAPFAAGDADIWDLLLTRARAAHVESVIVEGRPLMLGRRLQHLDRDALMEEVATAAASAVAKRSPDEAAWIEQLRRRIVEHYQAPVWHCGSS